MPCFDMLIMVCWSFTCTCVTEDRLCNKLIKLIVRCVQNLIFSFVFYTAKIHCTYGFVRLLVACGPKDQMQQPMSFSSFKMEPFGGFVTAYEHSL